MLADVVGRICESADVIVIFVSDTRQTQDSLPADTDFKREEEDHVKEARVTRLSPQCAARRHHSVLHIQFPVFKSDTQVLFSFSLYQTEYDNVTWELVDEKISMVPSAFFIFFAEEMN